MSPIRAGDRVPRFAAVAATGTPIRSDNLLGSWTLLQFHRFASCPACFVSVREFSQRHAALQREGLNLVAFFYSEPQALAEAFQDLAPAFQIVGDPKREIFDRFGVERSLRKFLDLRAWVTAAVGWSKGARFDPVSNITREDTAGVPADFFVDPDGLIQHAHYGTHAADSLNVDQAIETYHRLLARSRNSAEEATA